MLTPAQAADIAKVSRPTIMAAISSHGLKAIRDNRNRWQIDPEDLQFWMQGRVKPDTVTAVSDPDTSQLHELLHQNAKLSAQLEAKEEVITVLKEQIEYLRRPFWRRFF